MVWSGWPLERVLFLFVGIAFFAVGFQVTLSHYRQNFHHKAMWAPVLSAPIFGLCGIALSVTRPDWLMYAFMALMWLGVIIGLTGSYFHLHGVGIRVGGYTARNFLVGPPVALPSLFTAMSILGLIAVYWRG